MNSLKPHTFFKSSSPSILSLSSRKRVTSPAPESTDSQSVHLRLNEAVSKAISQLALIHTSTDVSSLKRPLPSGRGTTLGAVIDSELRAVAHSPNLSRAVLRSLHRPMSVLLSNMAATLIPLLSSPSFLVLPSVQAPNPSAAQHKALSLALFARELLDTLDDLPQTFDVVDIRIDALKSVREALTSIITRVVTPLVGATHAQVDQFIAALDSETTASAALASLHSMMPIYAHTIALYTSPSPTALATFLISVYWRSIVVLSHRQYIPPPPSKRRYGTNPSSTSPASRFSLKLPSSRHSSPPPPSRSTLLADATAIGHLFAAFPRPSSRRQGSQLAQDAVNEATEGLRGFARVLDAFENVGCSRDRFEALDLISLTEGIPSLIILELLVQMCYVGRCRRVTVADLLGIPTEEYRKGCLSSFGRADDCATTVFSRLARVDLESHILAPWICAQLKR